MEIKKQVDKLAISNQNRLLCNSLPIDSGTKSHSRNPLIFGLFVRIRMVEQVGSGIGRIKDFMKAAGLPLPEFKTDGLFTVVLKRPVKSSGKSSGKASADDWRSVKEKLMQKATVKIGKSSIKILEMIYRNQFVTIPEMAKKLGITERGVEKNIQKLKEQKLLERKEGERSGYWELIIHNS